MKAIYLHVGMHKTGSTSIQTALNKERLALIGQGVYVPLTGTEGNTRAHQNLAWELNRDDRFVPEVGSLADLRVELALERPEKVILSSEGFSSFDTRPGETREKQLQRLASADPPKNSRYHRLREMADSLGYAIVTVGFVRDYVSCLNSAYTQQVKTLKHNRSFADYIEQQHGNERWCYEKVFAGWEIISDQVICLPSGEDNVRTLFKVLGLEPTSIEVSKRRNTGVGPKTIECSRLVFAALAESLHQHVGQLRHRNNRDEIQKPPHKLIKQKAKLHNWDDDLFWGFDPDLARRTQAGFIKRDRSFLDKHGIRFSQSFEKKAFNDFTLSNASGKERQEFLEAVNDILADFGIDPIS